MPDVAAEPGNDAVSLSQMLGHPLLTLREAGALLGISDRVAMLTERSAFTRLLRIFHDLGLKDIRSFVTADDLLIDAVVAQHTSYAEEYGRSRGWFPIKPQPATAQGLQTLRDAVLNHAAARAHAKRVPRVPILWRSADRGDWSLVGFAEAVALVNGEAVFRSTHLANTISSAAEKLPYAVAAVANRCHQATNDEDDRRLFDLLSINITSSLSWPLRSSSSCPQ